jgi:hypothetical protein
MGKTTDSAKVTMFTNLGLSQLNWQGSLVHFSNVRTYRRNKCERITRRSA